MQCLSANFQGRIRGVDNRQIEVEQNPQEFFVPEVGLGSQVKRATVLFPLEPFLMDPTMDILHRGKENNLSLLLLDGNKQ